MAFLGRLWLLDQGIAQTAAVLVPSATAVMSDELRETERMLFKLEESRKNGMVAIRDLEQTKERLLSFADYAKDAQPEVLVTLIQTIVERIYIVDKDDERFCHIFIKGWYG